MKWGLIFSLCIPLRCLLHLSIQFSKTICFTVLFFFLVYVAWFLLVMKKSWNQWWCDCTRCLTLYHAGHHYLAKQSNTSFGWRDFYQRRTEYSSHVLFSMLLHIEPWNERERCLINRHVFSRKCKCQSFTCTFTYQNHVRNALILYIGYTVLSLYKLYANVIKVSCITTGTSMVQGREE